MDLGPPTKGYVPFVGENNLVGVGLPGVDLDDTDGDHARGNGIADGDVTHGADLDIPREEDGQA